MEVDAAHLLNVYDIDLIYSWTPREFKNFIKGAQLRTIDEYEKSAAAAMFSAKASNSRKRLKLKDIYDADKIRKALNNPSHGKKVSSGLSLDRYRRAKESMQGYSPNMEKKGGGLRG